MQDLQATLAEQVQIEGELAIDHVDQRQTVDEQLASVVDFMPHQFAKCRCRLAPGNRSFVYAELLHIVDGQVDPAPLVIGMDILPEVRQLQSGAGEIRKQEHFRRAIAAGVKNQPSYRVSRVSAVV